MARFEHGIEKITPESLLKCSETLEVFPVAAKQTDISMDAEVPSPPSRFITYGVIGLIAEKILKAELQDQPTDGICTSCRSRDLLASKYEPKVAELVFDVLPQQIAHKFFTLYDETNFPVIGGIRFGPSPEQSRQVIRENGTFVNPGIYYFGLRLPFHEDDNEEPVKSDVHNPEFREAIIRKVGRTLGKYGRQRYSRAVDITEGIFNGNENLDPKSRKQVRKLFEHALIGALAHRWPPYEVIDGEVAFGTTAIPDMVYFMPGNNNWEGESVEVAEQANEALRQAMHEGQFNIDQLTKENYLAIKKAVEGMRNGTTILNIEEIKTNVSDPEITPSQKEDYRRQVIFQAFTVLSSLFHFSPDDYSFDDFASEIIKNKGLNAYLVSASCPIKPLINEADFELRGLMESLEMFEDGYSDRIGAYSSGMKKIVRDLTLAIRMAIFGVEQEHTVQADPQAEAIKESKIIAEREQVQITPLNLEEFYRFQIRQFKKIEATTLIRQLLEEALEKELNAFRAKSPQAETIPDELREQIILALELKKAELKTKTNPQLRRMFSKRPLTKVRKRQGNKGTGGLPLFEPSTATKSPADVISPYVPVDVKDLATKVQFTDPFGFQSLMINFTGRHTTGGEFRFIPAPCA